MYFNHENRLFVKICALKKEIWGINSTEWRFKLMTDQQLHTLKKLLTDEQKRIKARPDNDEIFESTELSNYDNHPADQATDMMDSATELAMDKFNEFQLDNIEKALKAIDDGTYGHCIVCGIEIPFGRMEAMPTTLTCIEHSERTAGTQERPVEEEILNATTSDPSNLKDYRIDGEDSFLVVEEYGSSDTPSDVGYD